MAMPTPSDECNLKLSFWNSPQWAWALLGRLQLGGVKLDSLLNA